MLEAHLDAPEQILTATQLAQAAGYDDYVVANALMAARSGPLRSPSMPIINRARRVSRSRATGAGACDPRWRRPITHDRGPIVIETVLSDNAVWLVVLGGRATA